MNAKLRSTIAGAVMAGVLVAPSVAAAQSPLGPLNDLLALGQGAGQAVTKLPILRRAEPPLVATPRAKCDPGTRTEPSIQGRVPAGAADAGALSCNVTLLAHQGHSGGFRVWRYIDDSGRECAFYDTALLYPLNALKLSGDSLGVSVIDMSDPSHPVQTDSLTELPMLSPHESLNVNQKRGLIAAVLGNPATYPGLVSIYDAHKDCRHPVLQSTALVARFGHESGFSPDGKTFYAAGTALASVTAIDVTDPKNPHPIWYGQVTSHGMTIGDNGNRAYIADPSGNFLILDTSEIQARKPNPQAHEIARLTWGPASIPQNAIPFTENGHPYILEFDEYASGSGDTVGAGRIIDIANEREPQVISNLRLQVDQPADHSKVKGDPGALSPVQGYAAHYCNIPTTVNPKIVACSFIASGLRIFNIADIKAPREIGYYVAPTHAVAENGFMASDFAMSQPAFAPERHEIWYTDGASGFYVLRVNSDAWPAEALPTCNSKRKLVVTARIPKGAKVRSIRATLAGKAIKATRNGRTVSVPVKFAGLPRHAVQLVIKIKLRNGKTITERHTYHPCTSGHKSS